MKCPPLPTYASFSLDSSWAGSQPFIDGRASSQGYAGCSNLVKAKVWEAVKLSCVKEAMLVTILAVVARMTFGENDVWRERGARRLGVTVA